MLAGNPVKRNFTGGLDAYGINYACLGANKPETNELPNYNCPGGLRVQVFFPSCWDGVNLDSADHRSHMSYPAGQNYNNGPCPASHPVHLVSLFYEVLYDTNAFKDKWHGSTHPFVFSNGDTTGYGFHGDFVNGWDIDVLQKAVTECTNDSGRVEDCQHFTQFTGAESRACRIPSSIDELVSGTIPKLPGCNPITSGPEPAVSDGTCQDDAVIGQPQTFFTDLTVSKKWEYVGCGQDDYYERTLKGKSQSNDAMSVENCIDFCKTNGFSYAGLEYGRECYCDNSVLASKAPKAGVMGNCMMPCAGDAGEYCGGAAALSIYHGCSTGACQNAQFGVVGNGTVPNSGNPSGGNTSPSASAPAPAPAASSSAAAAPPAPPATSTIAAGGNAQQSTTTVAPISTPTPVKQAATSTSKATSTSTKPAGRPGKPHYSRPVKAADVTKAVASTPTVAASSTVVQAGNATPSPTSDGYNPDEWDCGDA